MSQTSKSDIIRAIFAAYLANDRTRVDNALADDFHFTSPYDDNIDKPTYFERCWNNPTGSRGTNSKRSWSRATRRS